MVMDFVHRVAITAPITAIAFDDDHRILYTGTCGQLSAYMNIGLVDKCSSADIPSSLNLFNTQTIHGIKLVKSKTPRVIVFGGKAVCIAIVQEMQLTERLFAQHRILIEILMENLDDLVLDCTMINDTLLIGYAHNFIDVMVNDPQSGRLKRSYRVQCAEISALFSLSIVDEFCAVNDGENLKVLVASGTAFGKIILWNFSIPGSKESRKEPIAQITDILTDHEGVIFRLQWSKNRGRIASISDDRTVRVWDLTEDSKNKQVFVGWGHISRLWDVVFLGEREDRVATCSEDSTIKLWDIEKKRCIATLRGHASDIWCLALASFNKRAINQTEGSTSNTAHIHTHHSEENLILFSGGNDSSVKSWPLSSQELSCNEEPSASLQLFPIPPVPAQNEITQGTSRRSNGVSAVHLSPTGLKGVVCLCDGGLWLVSFSTAVSAIEATSQGVTVPLDPAAGNPGWLHLGCLDKDITNADVVFHDINTARDGVDNQSRREPDHEDFTATIFCAHPDGFISEVKISAAVTGSSQIVNLSVTKYSWAAHKLRTINVWCQVLTDHTTGYAVCYPVSVSVKGVCRVWGPEPGPGLESSSADKASRRLLFEGSTGKENVATCVLLQPRAFIVGDSKGGITIFTLPDCAAGWSSISDIKGSHSATIFIPHAHGTELVSCLESNIETGGFYSAGHDGNFCVFTGIGEIANRLKCLPIKTPDKIFIVGRGDEVSYYIGGFLGGLYLVYDIRKGYQVLRLEGGGWKRPHHAVLCVDESTRGKTGDLGSWNSIPRVVFVCPAPVGKNTVLTYCDSDPILGLGSASRGMDYGSVLKNIPLHLGLPSHGKVSYCARILPICRAASYSRSERQTDHTPAQSLYVVTGGEDGNVRLFKHAQRALSDHHRALGVKTSSSQAVSDERGGTVAASKSSQFLQEVNMPGNVAVKAIAFAVRGKTETQRQIQRDKKRMSKSGDERENSHTEVEVHGIQQIPMSSGGIVIAVGGRLTYSLWEYNLQPDVSNSLTQYRGDDYEECESPVEGLSFLTSGSVSSSAEQDHRILSVQCVLLPHWYGTYVQNSAKKAARGESKEEERAAGREGQILSTDDTCSSSSSDGDRGGDGGGDDVYLVVMGDSRGIVTVATYDHGFEIDSKVDDRDATSVPKEKEQEFQVHDLGCPIISCDVLKCPISKRLCSEGSVEYSNGRISIPSSRHKGSKVSEIREKSTVRGSVSEEEGCLLVACLGDTAGIVSVWVLAGSVVPCGLNGETWRVLDASQHLFSYTAHAMGANTLSMILRPADSRPNIPSNSCSTPAPSSAPSLSSSSASVGGGASEGSWTRILEDLSWCVLTVSGGDDQAISVCSATLSLAVNEMGIAVVRSTHGFRRADGCSGSAIKGVKVLSTSSQGQDEQVEVEEGRAVEILQHEAGESFSILSAGYDQRLSIWRPLPSTLNVPQLNCSQSLCHSLQDNIKTPWASPTPIDQHADGPSMDSMVIMQLRDSLLEWRTGMAIHVGDVCALDAVTIHTQDPYQNSCIADSSPVTSECKSPLFTDDFHIKHAAQATKGEISEIAIVVVGEGYQVFTAVLQNHDIIQSSGSR